MSPDDQTSRTYSSPLRQNQAQRTRDLVLDALTELLATHRVDEVSTKQIAERARVSQPTVYRHFPDRAALVKGLTDRIEKMADSGMPEPETLEDWIESVEVGFRAPEENAAVAIAEAVLNADPRRFTPESRARTENMTACGPAIVPRARRSRPSSRCHARPHVHHCPDMVADAQKNSASTEPNPGLS